jgi:hypothetical protein
MLRGITFKQGNVTPHLDAIIHKFQMYNPSGIYDGIGGECGITAPVDYPSAGQAKVTLNAGMISIQGRHIYIDAGTEFTFTLSATSTGSLGVKIDLSQPAGSEVSFYTKSTYTLTQNDLAANQTTGVYEFEIYRFTATTSTLTLGSKTAGKVKSNAQIVDDFYGSGQLSHSLSPAPLINFIKRQGNLVCFNFVADGLTQATDTITIPEYCSEGNINLRLRPTANAQIMNYLIGFQMITVGTDGIITCNHGSYANIYGWYELT